jgi:hypothetical protein
LLENNTDFDIIKNSNTNQSWRKIYSKGFTLHANWYIIVRIFSIKGTKLAEITEQEFPLELFDLEYVKSEFELHGLRIDTLAFDKESKGFVIIEYKRDRNFSVVDQGMAYLNLMLNNRADFILNITKVLLHPPIIE